MQALIFLVLILFWLQLQAIL